MAIDFPDSPVNGQLFETGGKVYQYDGTKWVANTNVTKNDIGLGLVANRGPADVNIIQDQVDGTDNDTTVMSPYLTDEYVNRRVADQTEAEAGSDEFKLMSPLRVKQSILENAPSPTIATEQQAINGTDNTVFMTPLRTSQATIDGGNWDE